MDSKDTKRKADDQGRQLERGKQGLEMQQDRIELKLKALDVLTKRIGIVAAVVGLLVTALNIGLWVFQLKLTRAQASEQTEKNRVNLGMELTPLFDPSNPRKFWINAKFVNHSYKQVTIAMLGFRIWKQWSRETSVLTTPTDLLFSDNLINDCARVQCPVITSKTKLAKLDRDIVVTPNDQNYAELFGPYELSLNEAPSGFWLEGWAYTKEQDEGDCVVAKPATTDGAFPKICQQRFLLSPDCETRGRCKAAYAFAHPFRFDAPK